MSRSVRSIIDRPKLQSGFATYRTASHSTPYCDDFSASALSRATAGCNAGSHSRASRSAFASALRYSRGRLGGGTGNFTPLIVFHLHVIGDGVERSTDSSAAQPAAGTATAKAQATMRML